MSIYLREISSADLLRVNELLQDVSCFSANSKELHNWYTSYLSNSSSYCVVAVSSMTSECIGCASIFYHHRIRGGISATIEDVAVDKNFRGLKVGSQLIQHLIHKSPFCFKFNLQCRADVMPFYNSLNFEQSDINVTLVK